MEGPHTTFAPGDDVMVLFAARCARVFGTLVAFALDEPEAEPLEVAGGELVVGEGVGCGGDGGWGWVIRRYPSHKT